MDLDKRPEILYREEIYVSLARRTGLIGMGIFQLVMAIGIIYLLLPISILFLLMLPILVILVIIGSYSIIKGMNVRDLIIYRDCIQFSRKIYGSLPFSSILNMRIVNRKYSGTKYIELIKSKNDSYFISSRYDIGIKKHIEVVTDIDVIIKVLKKVLPEDIIKEENLEK
jgi:hypothetical protein